MAARPWSGAARVQAFCGAFLTREPAARGPTTDRQPIRRELAHRSSSGSDVLLLSCPADDSLAVTVLDPTGDSLEPIVDPAEALDVF